MTLQSIAKNCRPVSQYLPSLGLKRFCSNTNKTDKFSENYCLNLVQKHDHENFLCTLLLDDKKRRNVFSVRAFNVEIAKIGSTVSEDAIAKMKLKFWFDSIDKCFNDKSSYVEDHPVLKEIKNTTNQHKLSKIYFKRLVTARDRPSNMSFITIKDLEDYAEQTVSTIFYIILEIYGVKDINVDHAISHLGKAQGIVNLIRSIPFRKRSEAISIPQEILNKHGVSQERILRDKVDDKGVEECIFEVATCAHQHLEKSRQLSKHVPRSLTEIFLPAVAVQRYLDRLRKANFRLTDQNLLKRDNTLPIAYYWSKLRSKY
ncbi:NADH dehydrogenase (ubiquinone) complex I, assembly factor 6 homolog [Condylostylus longicornis]|uniref:NADH dehydrogenase (ubiquinone) complex I, assembly factor 6 homolog n=1 Tax=Condylostylus longicornis TaxID=2530218 RepID=UPI00244E0811|nr:NADH dehydrogenase (ubiquinone) complex I, assembly factor 6 homolog [Condylostylus longicornis]